MILIGVVRYRTGRGPMRARAPDASLVIEDIRFMIGARYHSDSA
ncbi:MAG: hypothetical protein ACXWXG_10980 [Actinomycetota bacterium]